MKNKISIGTSVASSLILLAVNTAKSMIEENSFEKFLPNNETFKVSISDHEPKNTFSEISTDLKELLPKNQRAFLVHR